MTGQAGATACRVALCSTPNAAVSRPLTTIPIYGYEPVLPPFAALCDTASQGQLTKLKVSRLGELYHPCMGQK